MIAAAAILCTVAAQAPLAVTATLAATDRLPPAWARLRELLPTEAPVAGDANARLTVGHDSWALRPTDESLPDGVAMAARIEIEGAVLRGECDSSGHERWFGSITTLELEPLRTALLLCDLSDVRAGPAWIDMATLIGHHAVGFRYESPLGAALLLTIAECGELLLQRGDGRDPTLPVLDGRGPGGVLLPLALLALSRRDATTPPAAAVRLVQRAHAARDWRSEEATLLLGVHAADPAVRDSLRRLLYCSGWTRVRALESLLRYDAASALEAALAAGLPEPSADELDLLSAALWRAFAAGDDRARARHTLRMRQLPAALAGFELSWRGHVAQQRAATGSATARRLVALLLLSTSALALWTVLRGHAGRAPAAAASQSIS